MRPLSPTYLCICKQTTPEIPEVTCTRPTIMGFFARDVPDMGYQHGGEIMDRSLPVVTHMQKLSY